MAPQLGGCEPTNPATVRRDACTEARKTRSLLALKFNELVVRTIGIEYDFLWRPGKGART